MRDEILTPTERVIASAAEALSSSLPVPALSELARSWGAELANLSPDVQAALVTKRLISPDYSRLLQPKAAQPTTPSHQTQPAAPAPNALVPAWRTNQGGNILDQIAGKMKAAQAQAPDPGKPRGLKPR